MVVMTELHPVTCQLQPLFDSTSLDAVAVELCRQAVDDYFQQSIFFESESFLEVLNTLYALNDNNLYSILQIGNSTGYTYFLMPQRQGFRRAVAKPPYEYLKSSEHYQRENLAVELKKVQGLVDAICVCVMKTLTYMTRRATGIKEAEEVHYPSFEELKLFYECKRKMAYDSVDAVTAGLFEENEAYLCSHCQKHHQGKSPSKVEEVADTSYLKRYKRAWRMRHRLGEFRHSS